METPSNAPASWTAAVFRRFTNALDRPQTHGDGFGIFVRGRLKFSIDRPIFYATTVPQRQRIHFD
jgi:hypothetical protein